MKQISRIIRYLVVSLCALMILPCAAFTQGRSQEGPIGPTRPGFVQVLVGFNEFPGRAEEALLRAHGAEISHTFWLVPAIAARIPEQAWEALERNPTIRYIEADAEVHATSQRVPWGIDRIFGSAEDRGTTWTITKGSGIGVAVLDTGIDKSHPDLTVLGGVTTVDSSSPFSDVQGHGTHVAGTIAALDNLYGVVGVGPGIDLYSVKVLGDNGSGTLSSVAAGIEWAVGAGIPVLNMSLGASQGATTLKDACDAAYARGHLLVASAGNAGNRRGTGNNVGYPAAYESVIAVAASDSSDRRASFSSTGPAVELIAPGVAVLSTVPGDGYASYNGTSMAAPHVAGAAALVWAALDPEETGQNVDVRRLLQETAQSLGLSSNHQGYGLVRADVAVAVAYGASGGDPVGDSDPVIVAFDLTDRSNRNFARLQVNWTVSDVDGDLKTVTTTLTGGSLSESESVTSTVSGSSASGEHNFSIRGGHGTYFVELTVTDAGDRFSSSQTKEITLQ